jgi:hypothetical protein
MVKINFLNGRIPRFSALKYKRLKQLPKQSVLPQIVKQHRPLARKLALYAAYKNTDSVHCIYNPYLFLKNKFSAM